MEQIALKASLRTEIGKTELKKIRKQGLVPAVVYHKGEEAVSISLPEKEFVKILRTAGGENLLINLTIEKSKKKACTVLIKEVQHHPVKRNVLHVDFSEVSLTEKIIVEVEVVAKGQSIGVKQEGGMMDHPLRMVKIQCLPTDIPKSIDVDVSALKLGDSIHVRDLKVSEKLKILNDADSLLFQVRLPVEEKVEDATAEAPEVEVMREKKEEEAPAGEKGKEEPKAKEAAPKAEKK